MRFLLFASALFLASETGIAQNPLPDYQWIGTGRVSAKINNKGALVTSFMVPNEDGDGNTYPQISTIGNISIWMGGIDPFGNLAIAIQRNGWAVSDFQGGFRSVPESGGVWKVTKEEIEQHKQDFEEDGDIDVMIPSIFSWPGRGSLYSQQLNGFSVDTLPFITAPFDDNNENGEYEPDLGEYPFLDDNTLLIRPPNEIVYAPFHTKETAAFVQMKMDCNAVFFAYDCDDATFLEDAIFGYVSMANTGYDGLDSFFLAFNINGSIGQPSDDYMGSLYNTAYFYNADSIDGSFGAYPPIFGFYSLGNLLDTFGHFTGVQSIMPIYSPSVNVMPGMTFPQLKVEYYNYMTGFWRDGSPLRYGGNGYQSSGQPTSYIFSGNPGIPGEWSEVSQNNLPGVRSALLSNGPTFMKPNAINRLVFALENVAGSDIAQQFETLKQYSSTQEDFFYDPFFPTEPTPFDSIPCLNTVAVVHPQNIPATLFPNPARTHLTLRTEESGLQQVIMFDMLGRAVVSRQNILANSQEVTLPVAGMSPGLYFLHWTMRDGRRGSGKVMITN